MFQIINIDDHQTYEVILTNFVAMYSLVDLMNFIVPTTNIIC